MAIARVGCSTRMPVRYWVAAGFVGAAPDLDAIGYSLGFDLPWNSIWSHRGLTHSLFFAVAVGGVLTIAMFPHRLRLDPRGVSLANLGRACPVARRRVWLILTLAMFSHGLADLLTNGGAGIALFSPVARHRFQIAYTPVEVSPLSISRFFSDRGAEVLWSELRWVLLPTAIVVAAVELVRAWRAKASA